MSYLHCHDLLLVFSSATSVLGLLENLLKYCPEWALCLCPPVLPASLDVNCGMSILCHMILLVHSHTYTRISAHPYCITVEGHHIHTDSHADIVFFLLTFNFVQLYVVVLHR